MTNSFIYYSSLCRDLKALDGFWKGSTGEAAANASVWFHIIPQCPEKILNQLFKWGVLVAPSAIQKNQVMGHCLTCSFQFPKLLLPSYLLGVDLFCPPLAKSTTWLWKKYSMRFDNLVIFRRPSEQIVFHDIIRHTICWFVLLVYVKFLEGVFSLWRWCCGLYSHVSIYIYIYVFIIYWGRGRRVTIILVKTWLRDQIKKLSEMWESTHESTQALHAGVIEALNCSSLLYNIKSIL